MTSSIISFAHFTHFSNFNISGTNADIFKWWTAFLFFHRILCDTLKKSRDKSLIIVPLLRRWLYFWSIESNCFGSCLLQAMLALAMDWYIDWHWHLHISWYMAATLFYNLSSIGQYVSHFLTDTQPIIDPHSTNTQQTLDRLSADILAVYQMTLAQ